MPSITERRTTDELAQERCRRNLFLGDRNKVLEELKQTMRLGIFLAELRYFRQDRLRMTFQYRELEDQGRVEHHICFFLERIHPFLLAAYNRRTTCDSLLGRITAVLVISYDATQEADIGCRNPVMVVNIDGGEGILNVKLLSTSGKMIGLRACKPSITSTESFCSFSLRPSNTRSPFPKS